MITNSIKILIIFALGLGWGNCQLKADVLTVAHFSFSTSNNISTMKKCNKCKEVKEFREFGKISKSKDGFSYVCKKCHCEDVKSYSKTKNGLLTQIYTDQRKASKKRKHSLPLYTKQELKEWMFSQDIFHKLYDEWFNSGFAKSLVPSCDRIDNSIGYSFDNIRIVTWQENERQGNIDMRNNIIKHGTRPQRTVIGTHITTGETIEFHSLMEAERQTGISNSNISKCCNDKYPTRKISNGYFWKYKLNT